MVSSNTSAHGPRLDSTKSKLSAGLPMVDRISTLRRSPFHWDTATVVLKAILDRTHDKLLGTTDVRTAMGEMLEGLWTLRCTSDSATWEAAIGQCVAHPVCQLIHEDPFAYRCFKKPRGYAGDAMLIDFLYTRDCNAAGPKPVSNLGARIFDFTVDIPAGHAVRRRRDLMATVIDGLCEEVTRPDILSVACGHLREASLSHAVAEHKIGRFVGLDQDKLSLATVERHGAAFGITTVHNSIKAIFRGALAQEKFDLIYSTGLYDYLDDRIATKLTHRMFQMLKPNGRLVVANFVPGLVCSAYMESFMDWKLIYRNESQMKQLTAAIPESDVAACKVFLEDNDNIVFLDIRKSASASL